MPEDMSEYMPEDMSDRMPEDMSEYMPEDMPDRMPEDMSDRVPEDMPDRMPEDLPDRMPEDMPDHMPEDMPDRMSNRMSEDMSDRMPEDLPVRKCINVMVGITRSKVIFNGKHRSMTIVNSPSWQMLTDVDRSGMDPPFHPWYPFGSPWNGCLYILHVKQTWKSTMFHNFEKSWHLCPIASLHSIQWNSKISKKMVG